MKLVFNILFFLNALSVYAQTENEEHKLTQEEIEKEINTLSKSETKQVLKGADYELPYRLRIKNKLSFACTSFSDAKISTTIMGNSNRICFENPQFKIVIGISNETYCVDDWKKLDNKNLTKVVRSTNVMIHMMKARDFYKNHPIYGSDLEFQDPNLKSESPSQVVIRIDQPWTWANGLVKKYSEEKLVNNVVTVPPSAEGTDPEKSWGKEIWFGIPETVKIKSDLEVAGDILNNRQIKTILASPFYTKYAAESIENFVRAQKDPIFREYFYHPFTPIISIFIMQGLVEGIPKLIQFAGKTYKRHLLLDAAMIPEIIYNEYSHIVLTNYYSIREISKFDSLLLTESIANYYSTKIGGQTTMVKNFTNVYQGYAPRKKEKNVEIYHPNFENNEDVIFSSYGLSLFYQFDNYFGEKLSDQIIATTIQSMMKHEGLVKSLETAYPKRQITIPYFMKKVAEVIANNEFCERFLTAAREDISTSSSSKFGLLDLNKLNCENNSQEFIKYLYRNLETIAANTGT